MFLLISFDKSNYNEKIYTKNEDKEIISNKMTGGVESVEEKGGSRSHKVGKLLSIGLLLKAIRIIMSILSSFVIRV